MGFNSVTGHNYGDMKLYFEKTKNTITMMQPSGTLQNLSIGDRNMLFNGRSIFYDLDNDLIGEIIYSPDKHGGGYFSKKKKCLDNYFKGSIYKMKNTLK